MEIVVDDGVRGIPCQTAGLPGALQGTREHERKGASMQKLAERLGALLAAVGKRQVGAPGVGSREAPLGFAVPN